MIKKLAMLLAAVTLCTNLGAITPAFAETEEVVLIESNFQSCNLGTYTAENQMDGEVDLRNGIVMVDDSDLSSGYAIKNGDSYEAISEADIVDDDGVKVLRLNTFIGTYNMTDGLTELEATYPVVKSTEPIPTNSKVKIDLELKMSPRAAFYFHHSKPNHANWRIWRFENASASQHKIKVLGNTDTGNRPLCNVYNKHTVVMDTTTGAMKVYVNDAFVWETSTGVMGSVPAWNQELFFRQLTPDLKPTVTFSEGDNTKIDSVENPQYVYVKSLKVTKYTDIEFESVTPKQDSKVVTPKEAVFTFSKDVSKVAGAIITPVGGEGIDVKSSLVIKDKTVTVPYNFEADVVYNVALTGVSDGISSVDAETTFTAEGWKFSNIIESPVSSSVRDDSVYFVDEDFEASDNSKLILSENLTNGWYIDKSAKTTITELEDGSKALELATGADFTLKYDKSLGLLDDSTTLSYDVYVGAGTKFFNVDRDDFSTSVKNRPVATWNNGYYKNGTETAPMSAEEWHNVMITISDIAGTTIYVDGNQVMNIEKSPEYAGISETSFFRFKANGGSVIIDNLKLYLNKKQTALTGIYPEYDATDIPVADELEFTYSGAIGDVSGAKLTIKPNDTNMATVLTNGNGMTVSCEGNKVKIALTEALKDNTGYALELSDIITVAGSAVEPVRTRFSTVYDSAWEVKDFESTSEGATSKKYTVKVKNETDALGARMVVAVYDQNGYLENVAFSEPAVAGTDWIELSATVDYTQGNTSKIFIWDSLEGMNLISGIITD